MPNSAEIDVVVVRNLVLSFNLIFLLTLYYLWRTYRTWCQDVWSTLKQQKAAIGKQIGGQQRAMKATWRRKGSEPGVRAVTGHRRRRITILNGSKQPTSNIYASVL